MPTPTVKAFAQRCATRLLLGSLLVAMASRSLHAQTSPRVGDVLPPWTPGTLDIHQISTGRGNSAFLVLPDGTTLLVDAGAAADGLPQTDIHPDASRAPGEWIARYVRRHLPPNANGIDFALITHFHADHFGQVNAGTPTSSHGAYRLSGITQVGDVLPIHTLIDRGWPDYSYPTPLTDATTSNYRAFIDAQRTSGLRPERFRVGSNDQIHLAHDRIKYPQFEIRNVVGNGVVWTGHDTSTRSVFPPLETTPRADWPNENMCSLGIRLTYGAFRYFTGGDLPGTPDPGFPAWHSLESAVADVVGPVNVHVVNQHGSMGEESEPFMKALASSVLIIPSWATSHPAPDVLKRIVNSRFAPRERLVFATDMRAATRMVIGQRADSLAGPPGHIVVRVEPGGGRFWVVVLTNSDESDRIVAVRGPFQTIP